MSNLENAIQTWKRKLRSSPAFEDGDIAELESHLRDEIERLKAEDYSEEKAFEKAVDEIGEPEPIGDEFYKTRTTKIDATPSWNKKRVNLTLLPSYLRTTVRHIKRTPLFSAINVFSLSLGIAFSILAFSFIDDELSFDNFHKNGDNIYRVAVQMSSEVAQNEQTLAVTQPALGPALLNEIPEVKRSVRMGTFEFVVNYNNQAFREKVLVAEEGFFEMFSFPLLVGSPSFVLTNPESLVLSKKMVQKYFGDKQAIGESFQIQIGETFREFTVTGVADNVPGNSSIQFDFVIPYKWLAANDNDYDNFWGAALIYNFLQISDEGSPNIVNEKMRVVADTHLGDMLEAAGKPRDAIQYKLQPIKDLHLNTQVKLWPSILLLGPPPVNITYSLILAGVALIVLLIGSVNFVSFTISNSTTRAREIGVRKALGAQRKDVIHQFWGETLIVTFLALLVGLGMARGFLPLFNELADKQIITAHWFEPTYLSAFLGIWVFVSLLAGVYPSLILSGFKPVHVLKNIAVVNHKTTLAKGLVTTQYIATITLVIGVFVISRQMSYMQEQMFKTEKNQVLLVRNQKIGNNSLYKAYKIFRNELRQNGIDKVTASYGTLEDNYWRNGFGRQKQNLTDVRMLFVDYNYLDIYEYELIKGRFFNKEITSDSSNKIVVNEAFVKESGLKNPIGTILKSRGDDEVEIIGVVKDFHFESLHTRISPAALVPLNEDLVPTRYISIKFDPNETTSTLETIRHTWDEVHPSLPLEYSFLDDKFETIYRSEFRWKQIVFYASMLSILIACLGLAALSSLAVKQRRKEMSIRKILGASTADIVLMLEKEFIKPVLTGFFLAIPLAYYILHQWLKNFAYRINLEGWIFLVAGALVIVTALIIVGWQSVRAALMNPVKSLRSE